MACCAAYHVSSVISQVSSLCGIGKLITCISKRLLYATTGLSLKFVDPRALTCVAARLALSTEMYTPESDVPIALSNIPSRCTEEGSRQHCRLPSDKFPPSSRKFSDYRKWRKLKQSILTGCAVSSSFATS